jgi:hypothetical protein
VNHASSRGKPSSTVFSWPPPLDQHHVVHHPDHEDKRVRVPHGQQGGRELGGEGGDRRIFRAILAICSSEGLGGTRMRADRRRQISVNGFLSVEGRVCRTLHDFMRGKPWVVCTRPSWFHTLSIEQVSSYDDELPRPNFSAPCPIIQAGWKGSQPAR